MHLLLRHITLVGILFLVFNVEQHAQEIPRLSAFNPQDLPGKNQNWMITQDYNGKLFVANSSGIMIYNGFTWKLVSLPNESIVRSIFRSSDGCIYAGGYETFGFIDDGDINSIRYVPLSDKIPTAQIAQQEMWNVFEQDSTIYWQSFSTLYAYNTDSLYSIIPPTNIMFAQEVGEEILIPSLERGIFQLDNQSIVRLSDKNNLPTFSRVAGISPFDTESLLVGTQDKGVFLREKGKYVEVDLPINSTIKEDRLNRLIKLSNGMYALGTILNGLYILDNQLRIKYHLNKSNGLPNNTILALYEDRDRNLWIGMDQGLCFLELDSQKRIFYDQTGLLGKIYCAAEYNSSLYVGTNQGLFYLNQQDQYELIPETQGQVWSLLTLDEKLLCGHNSGTFLIDDKKCQSITTNTGVWDVKIADEQTIIQTTYTGISRLTKDSEGKYQSEKYGSNGILIRKFVVINNQLFGIHPQQGIYIITFNEDFSEITETYEINKQDRPSVKLTDIKVIDGKIILKSETQLFEIQRDTRSVARSSMGLNSWLQIPDSIPLPSDIATSEFVPIINSNTDESLPYLFQEIEGYFTLSTNRTLKRPISVDVEGLSSKNKSLNIHKVVPASENNLTIELVNNAPSFQAQLPIEYQLRGYDQNWRAIPKDGAIQARNLDPGTYQLLVRHIENPTEKRVLFAFKIAHPWYESKIAYAAYLLIACAIGYFFFHQHKRRLTRIEAELKSEQQEKLDRAQMKARNEQLEQEVKYKSKMLANNAMTLIQKNKMLQDLKLYLSKASKEQSEVEYHKIFNLINRNIKSDDDWDIFEKNFAEVHDDFLKSLKEEHPNLTSGELRLAAYIRMNLSSKEIAPLLNISTRSVENKRHRLRKKLELANSDSLIDYLMRYN